MNKNLCFQNMEKKIVHWTVARIQKQAEIADKDENN